MPHLLEPAAILEGADYEWICPFPHERKESWPEYDNDFCGDSKTLREKMKKGQPTILNRELSGGKPPRKFKVKHPSLRSKSEKGFNPVAIPTDSGEAYYPLICAGHHLIPAQASLRESKLVHFLYTGTAVFKKKEKHGGKLIANVGYDVNGAQNGMWLPGPYALTINKAKSEKKGCRGKRTSLFRSLKSVERVVEVEPDSEDKPEKGGKEEIELSLYELYAVSAMKEVEGQYHDAHPDYNTFVLKVLNQISTETGFLAFEGKCNKCGDRKKGTKLPPPYGLVERLNHVSKRLKGYLKLNGSPSTWRKPVYTSSLSALYQEDQEAFDKELG